MVLDEITIVLFRQAVAVTALGPSRPLPQPPRDLNTIPLLSSQQGSKRCTRHTLHFFHPRPDHRHCETRFAARGAGQVVESAHPIAARKLSIESDCCSCRRIESAHGQPAERDCALHTRLLVTGPCPCACYSNGSPV